MSFVSFLFFKATCYCSIYLIFNGFLILVKEIFLAHPQTTQSSFRASFIKLQSLPRHNHLTAMDKPTIAPCNLGLFMPSQEHCYVRAHALAFDVELSPIATLSSYAGTHTSCIARSMQAVVRSCIS